MLEPELTSPGIAPLVSQIHWSQRMIGPMRINLRDVRFSSVSDAGFHTVQAQPRHGTRCHSGIEYTHVRTCNPLTRSPAHPLDPFFFPLLAKGCVDSLAELARVQAQKCSRLQKKASSGIPYAAPYETRLSNRGAGSNPRNKLMLTSTGFAFGRSKAS